MEATLAQPATGNSLQDWNTVHEIATWARVSSKMVYAASARGDLRTARVGRVLRVHRTWATDWLFGNAEGL